jgi:hypothetical protein
MSTSNDVDPAALDWLGRFASSMGVSPLTQSEVATVLDLAGVAAHASHRQAAPVACWLAARAGLSPTTALERAVELV